MFESVFVFSLTAFLMYLFSSNLLYRETQLQNKGLGYVSLISPEIIACISIFTFVVGARYNVGVDYFHYLEDYNKISNGFSTLRDDYEIGYLLITKFISYCNLHYFFFFAVWGFLQIVFILLAFQDRKQLIPFVCLYIVLGPFLLNWMNGIRQSIAICAFVFASKYIVKRNFIKYIISVLIISLIHKSALILVPVYFILYVPDRFFNYRKINLLILIACIILSFNPYWLTIFNDFSHVIDFLGYDFYTQNVDILTSTEHMKESAIGPTRLLSIFVGIFIIWFYTGTQRYYDKDNYIIINYKLFLIGTFLINLLSNTNAMFLRPLAYLTIFQLPMAAYVLLYLKKKRQTLQFYLLFVFMFSHAYFMFFKSAYFPVQFSERFLYRFFFE